MSEYQTLLALGAGGVLALVIVGAVAAIFVLALIIAFLKTAQFRESRKRYRRARERFAGRHARRR